MTPEERAGNWSQKPGGLGGSWWPSQTITGA